MSRRLLRTARPCRRRPSHLHPRRSPNGRSTSPSKRAPDARARPGSQQPRVRGQQPGHSLGRGVSPVGAPEGVVDAQRSAALGEHARELLVIRRLARIEARVLEHGDTVVPDQFRNALAHRRHRESDAILFCLRSPEVRADAHLLRPVFEQQLDRGQRRPDPGVVHDLPVLERNVQVGANENDLAANLRGPNGTGDSHVMLKPRACSRGRGQVSE